MSLPVIRQQNASQIRMTVKNDSEQIERFAFVPIRRAPDSRNGRHVHVVLAQHNLQTNAMVFGGREKMVVDFEARIFFNAAIDATNISQKIEPTFRPTLQKSTHGRHLLSWNDDGRLAKSMDDFRNPFRMFML